MADLDPFDEYGDQEDIDPVDEPREPRSAKRVLQVIKDSEREFSRWQKNCDRIDKLYSSLQSLSGLGLSGSGQLMDREYNLFWASVEVIKPSIYSRPPVPVVVPKFKDRNPVKRVTAELLERSCISAFDISDIDQTMLAVRDDLVITARGQTWLSYETKADSDTDYEKVCIEHLDRYDFGHEWGRKWAEVGIVWRHAWLTRREARKRFLSTSGEVYQKASYGKHKDDLGDGNRTEKARFSEVWNKYDNKVQWVAEGCDVFLDEDEPHLKLTGFFPCPRPAYATVERRSLIPVPDISYIEDQLETINELTVRIHDLCDKLVVKGIVPAGTDIGDAIQTAYKSENASQMLIPVPAMSLSGGAALVEWLPIDQVAQTILSAVQARREIIGNVQELFGIADIMRGETEAQETLGAQELKAQFGAVRIRDRVSELVRIARDTVVIAAEIMAEQFSVDTLLDMAQMELPTDAEISKQMKALKDQAKSELEAIHDQAEQALGQQQDPQAAQAMQQQANQAIQAVQQKYAPEIEKLSQEVTVEAVKAMLRDNKTRPFTFDIETDSTISPDENAEKASRNEFMTAFATTSQALAPLVQTGPAGARLAGDLLKFQLAPYRPGRQLDGAIDEWIDSVQNQPKQEDGKEEQKALIEAQNKLAEAEIQKAKAATMSVEARAASETQKLQAKVFEMQQKAAAEEQKAQLEVGALQGKLAEQDAKINLMQAQTAEILSKIGLDVRKQDLEEYKAATDTQFKADDQMRSNMQLEQQATESEFDREQRLRGEDRQDRSQSLTEQQMQQEQSNAS